MRAALLAADGFSGVSGPVAFDAAGDRSAPLVRVTRSTGIAPVTTPFVTP